MNRKSKKIVKELVKHVQGELN